MKIFRKTYDPTNIDFQDNNPLQSKVIDENDLLDQSKELKRIKNTLEIQNIRLNDTFNNLHLAIVIVKKDNDGDYILVDYNKKSQIIDKLTPEQKGEKLKNIYKNIENFQIINLFDNVLLNGIPIKHQGYYKDDKIKGYRDSYIYRIESDGKYELVTMYDDVTTMKKSEIILKKIRTIQIYIWLLLITTISIMFFHINNTNKKNYNEIYTEYYNKSDISIMGTMRSSSNNKSIIYNGTMLYQNGEYEKALETFKKDNNINTNFYLGITNMEIGNYGESIKNFKKIIEENNSLFVDQSEWLLSLCYIKLNKKVDAILILSKIANNPSHYKNKESLQILKNYEK